MTEKQLADKSKLTVYEALCAAFNAGCSYAIGSHKDFVQTHEPKKPVCDALAKRLIRS